MSLTTIVTVALGVAGHLANAQGFIHNCTWQTGLLSQHFLGMYCNDDAWDKWSYDWSWLDINTCLANSGGNLYPGPPGDYWSTCGNCGIYGSNQDFVLACNCINSTGGFTPSKFDLNLIVWNIDGTLGCFNHVGNKTEKGPF
ncbi:hypothetical protein F4804DRAFT_329140 [Jackrogersella minutella]|nr:hypothetical protein F4804DRAFT_329140 [Jackrogersella minutella]